MGAYLNADGTDADKLSNWYSYTASPWTQISLPFVQGTNASKQTVYRYDNSSFFPIDNQLDGNYPGWAHNFHFTMESDATFIYNNSSDYFSVSSDDDVWIFVNGRLFLDEGGVHATPATPTKVYFNDWLSTLGGVNKPPALTLVPGQPISVSIFYAERHTVAAQLHIETTCPLAYTPAYLRPEAAAGETSAAGVNYFDGAANNTVNDLAGLGFDDAGVAGVGQTRAYVPAAAALGENWGNGYGWFDEDQPVLMQDAWGYVAMFSPTQAYSFDGSYNSYAARYGAKEKLTYDSSHDLYKLAMPDGSVYTFHGFVQTADPPGSFNCEILPGGEQWVTHYKLMTANSSMKLDYIEHKLGSGGTAFERLQCDYDANGMLLSVVFETSTDGTAWPAARSVVYGYYDGSDPTHGSAGDLKTVKQHPGGTGVTATGTWFYTYYADSLGSGFKHGVRYVVPPQGYADAGGTISEVEGALDSYASSAYTYYADARVDVATVYDASAAGQESYSYLYTPDDSAWDDYNIWQWNAYETRPDGSHYTVYDSFTGQDMLTDLTDGSSHIVAWNHYDQGGRLDEAAQPSAVKTSVVASNGDCGYDDTHADLDPQLYSGSGLIDVYAYYVNSDTLTSGSTPGGVVGYLKASGVQEGTGGTPVWQSSVDYVGATVHFGDAYNQVTTYYTADSTQYQTDHSSLTPPTPSPSVAGVQNTTNYQYTFWTTGDLTSPTIETETTTLPVASDVAMGGTVKTVDWHDDKGRLVIQEDGRGRFSYYDYYDGTTYYPYLQETVQDVGAWTGIHAPEGWTGSLPSVPTDGLSAPTDYLYDPLGRLTQTLGPPHYATIDGVAKQIRSGSWTYYDDADLATFAGQGLFDPSSHYTLTNPVSVEQSDADGNVTGDIQATVNASTWVATSSAQTEIPLSSVLPLTLFATISVPTSTSTFTAWSTDQYRQDQRVSARQYTVMPASDPGSAGVNYNQTDYGYDADANQTGTVDPAGDVTASYINAFGEDTADYKGQMERTAGSPPACTFSNLVPNSGLSYDVYVNAGAATTGYWFDGASVTTTDATKPSPVQAGNSWRPSSLIRSPRRRSPYTRQPPTRPLLSPSSKRPPPRLTTPTATPPRRPPMSIRRTTARPTTATTGATNKPTRSTRRTPRVKSPTRSAPTTTRTRPSRRSSSSTEAPIRATLPACSMSPLPSSSARETRRQRFGPHTDRLPVRQPGQ